MTLVAILTVALVVWASISSSHVERRPVVWKDLTRSVGRVAFSGLERHRFRKRHDFLRFIRIHQIGGLFRAPIVDFSHYEIELFAVGPRSSSGYSLSVRQVYESDGKVVVVVDEQSPRLGSRARAVLTYPFVVVRLPRGDETVLIDWPQHP